MKVSPLQKRLKRKLQTKVPDKISLLSFNSRIIWPGASSLFYGSCRTFDQLKTQASKAYN